MFNILKLIYLYYNNQLPLKLKAMFTANESVNPYNTKRWKVTSHNSG